MKKIILFAMIAMLGTTLMAGCKSDTVPAGKNDTTENKALRTQKGGD